MILNIINEEFSVCKVADYEGIDLSSPYIFIGSTDEEKSLVCPILECKEGPFVEHEIDGILEIRK